MAPYYFAIILLNILVSALLYFAFGKKRFSYRSIVLITGISLLTGLLFPTLVGYLNIYIVLILGLLAVGTSSYYLVKTDSDYPVKSVKEEETIVSAHEVEAIKEEALLVEDAPINGPISPEVSKPVKKLSKKKRKKEKKQKQKHGSSIPEAVSAKSKIPSNVAVISEEKLKAEVSEIEVPEIEIPEIEVSEIELPEIEIPEAEVPEVEATELTMRDDNMEDSRVSIQTQPSGDSEELRESYIMRGFDAKGSGDYNLAVKYFESAIELNPPVDLAEMIQFDIYTMLREQGLYSKAKESLAQFFGKYSSQLSATSANELKSQIKYIEILQDMLKKANSPNLPYSRIPALIKMSAEEKFSVWKSESLY